MEINSHRTELEKNVDAELEIRNNKANKLEEELAIERKEIDRPLKIKSLLNDSTTPTVKTQIRTVDLDFPGYPIDGNNLDKIRYMEDHLGRMWHKKEMSDLLEKAEGNKKESEHLSSKIYYYCNTAKKLITVTYGNSKHFSFYTTRPEWIEKIGTGNYRIKRGHEPAKEYLDRLPDDKKTEISWKGVENFKS